MLNKMALLLNVQTLTLQLNASRFRNNCLLTSIQEDREVLAQLKQWLGVPSDTKIWRSELNALLNNRLKQELQRLNETVRTF